MKAKSAPPALHDIAVRYNVTSTNRSLEAFLGLLADRNIARVVLFATPVEQGGAFDHRSDGPTSNLPLVAALAQFAVPGVSSLYVVFDGLFLTAQRLPRYSEVSALYFRSSPRSRCAYPPGGRG